MSKRASILSSLIKDTDIGIELGVADGYFSAQILSQSNIKMLYSIDMWAGDRGHDIKQYKTAIKKLLKFANRNYIIKLKFEEALDLFDDNYFDFIYIDGYAHTGQDSGKTLYDWWPKLKSGGIFSGHDYDSKFPIMIKTVDSFIVSLNNNYSLKIIEEKPYNSWYIIKNDK
jgi:predicted O-methyltransferase YrrM